MRTIITHEIRKEAAKYAVEVAGAAYEADDLYNDILSALSDIGRQDDRDGTDFLGYLLYGPDAVSIREFAEDRGLADQYNNKGS